MAKSQQRPSCSPVIWLWSGLSKPANFPVWGCLLLHSGNPSFVVSPVPTSMISYQAAFDSSADLSSLFVCSFYAVNFSFHIPLSAHKRKIQVVNMVFMTYLQSRYFYVEGFCQESWFTFPWWSLQENKSIIVTLKSFKWSVVLNSSAEHKTSPTSM